MPQGSVLGPLLFILYINEVAKLPLTADSKLAMYADDILLYRPVRFTVASFPGPRRGGEKGLVSTVCACA